MRQRLIMTLLVMTIGFSERIMGSDSSIEQDKTELISFIIQTERLIVEMTAALDQAFADCFGNGLDRNNYKYALIDDICTPINIFNGEKLSKLESCTDEKIQALCSAELAIEETITEAVKTIAIIAKASSNNNMQDGSGKTALDYCVTPLLRKALHRQGITASFWGTWLFSNRKYIATAAFVALSAGFITTLNSIYNGKWVVSSAQTSSENPTESKKSFNSHCYNSLHDCCNCKLNK
jgi:hypothetical protein